GRELTEMADPVISVVIPTYNHAQFLKAALDSVRAQTFADWEAIVVNNYSEDNTEEIVASFHDSRIRLVNFRNHGIIAASRNHGIIAASRNHGIALSRGKYVAFLDSDDTWYAEKLARCVAVLESGYDAVCHGEYWVKASAPPRAVRYGPESRTSYDSLLFDGNCLSTSALVVKRAALDQAGGFDVDPALVTAEDYELWLRLARNGCRYGILDDMLGEYLLHGGNQSKAVMRNFRAELAVLNKHFALTQDLPRLRQRRRIALAYYAAARGLQSEGQYKDSLGLLLQSWVTYPFILRQYAAAAIGLIGWLRGRRPAGA
ncbi:MAG TPA: glycosyltransferase, partial [Burkholderiales bacterium]|nr:glycosyltransferase [Burkholderiales bacterium]